MYIPVRASNDDEAMDAAQDRATDAVDEMGRFLDPRLSRYMEAEVQGL